MPKPMPARGGLEFGDRYAVSENDVAMEIERQVFGTDYGANGYMTVGQADDLAARLALGPADRLLDLGAGCGWPGLYLASKTGCAVVSSDLPEEGLHRVSARARADGLTGRAGVVRADGRHLPFTEGSFTRIIHADVLC